MPKILYLECGRATDKAFSTMDEIIHMVPEYKISDINLLRYDIVIIPSYSNQDFLKREWPRIDSFLSLGGVVIALGAVQDKNHWLPHIRFHSDSLDEVIVRNSDNNDAKSILGEFASKPQKLRFHDSFVSHGYMTTDRECATPILTGNNPNHLIAALVEFKGKEGVLLITTLDPDYHSIVGHTKDKLKENENAWLLLKQIIKWAKSRSENKGLTVSKIRRLIGFSREVATLAAIFLFLGICTASTLGVAFKLVDENLFQNIAAATSVISFAFTVLLFMLKR